ncbi:MAG: polymer-forming cytoskeletal protein [Phycisphaerae bacterium]|nr:polymer-forming cytoskeletal protein [Phycisphaerae bacterium]
MAEADNNHPTILGNDVFFKGELRAQKGVRLLGKFEGNIQSESDLVIADGASMNGNIKSETVRVEGQVKGNLEAVQKVSLAASARVEGDLQTARLEVAEGAMLVGQCMIGVTDKNRGDGRASGADRSRNQPAVPPQPAVAGKK